MLKIRLQRVGRKNDPSFRVVVTDKSNGPKSGAFLEILGSYDPRKKRIDLKNDRIKEWLTKGAQLSTTVHNLFVDSKLVIGEKIGTVPAPKKKEEEEVHKDKPEDKKEAKATDSAPVENLEKKENKKENDVIIEAEKKTE
jgi:small subunit ribosomal protein S16